MSVRLSTGEVPKRRIARSMNSASICLQSRHSVGVQSFERTALKALRLQHAVSSRNRKSLQSLGSVHTSRQNTIVYASSPYKDPYDILGVQRNSTIKEIKQAFRRKALQLHPDVNKAPNAKEQFMECKNAYQEIIDARKVSSSGTERSTSSTGRRHSGNRWEPPHSASQVNKDKEKGEAEEFYGFADLFRDLESEWKNKTKTSNEPKDLWEELADIGEEFVEFLEKGIGISEDAGFDSSTANKGNQGVHEKASYTSAGNDLGSQNGPSVSRRQNVDDELEELKRKMGL